MRYIVLPRGLTGAVATPNVEIAPPAGVAVFEGLVPEVGAPLRETVFEGDYSTTDGSDNPWAFYNNQFNPAVMSMALTTLNGANAIAVTWTSSALPGDRWGGRMLLPEAHPEVWYTYDIMFGPYFSRRGQKLPGFDDNPPTNQFHAQLMSSGRDSPSSFFTQDTETDDLPLRLYWRDQDNSIRSTHWNPPHVPLNTVARIELHYRVNSSPSLFDGIFEARWDIGTATAHADPVTLRGSQTNQRWYKDSQSRSDAFVIGFLNLLFFGGPGNDPAWSPIINSTVTLGAFKAEVPA